MSERIGKVAYICEEPERPCELCGKTAETRPYGPRGERICFECGMKDQDTTKRQMDRRLFGKKGGAYAE